MCVCFYEALHILYDLSEFIVPISLAVQPGMEIYIWGKAVPSPRLCASKTCAQRRLCATNEDCAQLYTYIYIYICISSSYYTKYTRYTKYSKYTKYTKICFIYFVFFIYLYIIYFFVYMCIYVIYVCVFTKHFIFCMIWMNSSYQLV